MHDYYNDIKIYREERKLPHDYFQRLLTINRSLVALNPQYKNKVLDEESAHILRKELELFRELAGAPSPLHYYSKLEFVELLLQEINPNTQQELLLRFIADRTFLFAIYRDIGNDINDPPLSSRVLSDDLWKEYYLVKDNPIHLINACLKSLGKQKKESEKNADNSQLQLEYIEIAQKILTTYQSPPASYAIEPEKLLKDFSELCHKREGLDVLQEDAARKYFEEYILFYDRYLKQKASREHEWLPTSSHAVFYKQYKKNYNEIEELLLLREDNMRFKQYMLQAFEKFPHKANSYNRAFERKKEDEYITYLKKCKIDCNQLKHIQFQLVKLFEKYVQSLLHFTRNKVYTPILSRKGKDRYMQSILALLCACRIDEGWHPLAPLFLYHAFANNTKAILIQTKPKRKLVKKISLSKKPAKVSNLTSMTGRRAAVNLVLFQKLHEIMPTRKIYCRLGRMKPEDCIKHADQKVESRINRLHCGLISQNEEEGCPFACNASDYVKFGFYLISGYGHLYHHTGSKDEITLSYDKLCPEKGFDAVCNMNEEKYEVFTYHFNLMDPVGKLEGILESNIRECFPNRQRYLTLSTPKEIRKPPDDPFFSAYEELSTLLLQDAHLPSMQRISRRIKKILSEHPQYKEGYRRFLIEPTPTSVVSDYLKKIVASHRLVSQVQRYDSYTVSSAAHNINDSLNFILEYEIRAQIFEEAQNQLRSLLDKYLPETLFQYPIYAEK